MNRGIDRQNRWTTVELSPRCAAVYRPVFRHEFGHVLGFIPARGVVQGEELVTVQGEGLFPRARGRRSSSAGSAST